MNAQPQPQQIEFLSKNQSDTVIPSQSTSLSSFAFSDLKQELSSIIILNGETNFQMFSPIIKNVKNIILADGGANSIYKNEEFRDLPNIRTIVGDLDSIDQEVRQYYEARGVKITQCAEQDTNDFQKALSLAGQYGWHQIGVLGAYGNRIDHFLASFSIVTRLYKLNNLLDLIFLNPYNIAYPLKANLEYRIKIGTEIQSKGCGLIPFGRVENIETEGFRWNLGRKTGVSSLEWGQFISSSNEFVEKEIQVFSSSIIFLTAQLKFQ